MEDPGGPLVPLVPLTRAQMLQTRADDLLHLSAQPKRQQNARATGDEL
jgi:hypothetical protein